MWHFASVGMYDMYDIKTTKVCMQNSATCALKISYFQQKYAIPVFFIYFMW